MNRGFPTLRAMRTLLPGTGPSVARHARLWVLVLGLLCVSGQQFLESTHAHAADDVATYCQLCSGFTDTGVTPAAVGPFQNTKSITRSGLHRSASPATVVVAFLPRGPPVNT